MNDTVTVEARLAQQVLKARRRRGRHFGPALFADPAWDMLLDLFVAEGTGRSVSTSDLCIGSGVPQTTALRWIKALERQELVARAPDDRDARRVFVSLTPKAVAEMRSLLATTARDLRQLLAALG